MTRKYTIDPDVARARARKGGILKNDPAADTTGVDAELAAAKVQDYIERAVAEAPSLSLESERGSRRLSAPGGDRDAA
jgi:hypothetical protein